MDGIFKDNGCKSAEYTYDQTQYQYKLALINVLNAPYQDPSY
jgi:hypothetical protein